MAHLPRAQALATCLRLIDGTLTFRRWPYWQKLIWRALPLQQLKQSKQTSRPAAVLLC
jgi:hypothetical protein